MPLGPQKPSSLCIMNEPSKAEVSDIRRHIASRPTRIGINLTPLRWDGGGARYAFESILLSLLRVEQNLVYLLFADAASHDVVAAFEKRVNDPARVRLVKIEQTLEIFSHADNFDVFFCPLNNVDPRLFFKPSLAILHDIQDQIFQQYFSPADREGRNEHYRDICRGSTLTATVSAYSRSTILERFSVEPDRLKVLYNAPQPLPGPCAPEALESWLNGRPFWFYPANFYPHKDHALLMEHIAAERLHGPAETALVLVGSALKQPNPINESIRSKGLGDSIFCLSGISDAEMAWLYRHTLAVIIPSRFEGFCMPAVEAASLRAPLICSDLAVLHEILGETPYYFAPGDAASLKSAIARFTADKHRQARQDEAARRASVFSWDQSARTCLAFFQEAFAIHNGLHTPPTKPRIGLVFHYRDDVLATWHTVRSIARTSRACPGLRVAALGPRHSLPPECLRLLDECGALQLPLDDHDDRPAIRHLLNAAEKLDCEIVGEIAAGDSLNPEALPWLAVRFAKQPGQLAWMTETLTVDVGTGTALHTNYMRLKANDIAEFSGLMYPGAIWLNPHALANSPELRYLEHEAPTREWRWEALRRLHLGRKIAYLRVTTHRNRPANAVYCDIWHRAAATTHDRFTIKDPFPHRTGALWLLGRLVKRFLRKKGRR